MSKSIRDSRDAPIVTDPYSVPVGKTAPNNPPFIVKGSEVLPAEQEGLTWSNVQNNGDDSHVETTHDMPELNDRRYHKEELVSFLYSYGYKTYLRVYKVATAESRSVIIWLASRMKSRAAGPICVKGSS